MARKLITEYDISEAAKKGLRSLAVQPGTIVTPSARDAANLLRIDLVEGQDVIPETAKGTQGVTVHGPLDKRSPQAATVIALGSDHGGFALKKTVREFILELGYTVFDVGTETEQPCDYPDFAYAVASMVASGQAKSGIMIDAVGVASAMAANKVPGIRAAACSSEFAARSSREHNDANVLTLGGRVIGSEVAKSIVKTWLETWFGGGRHQSRVQKITEIEKKFSR